MLVPYLVDDRQDDDELRQIAIGYLDGRLHLLKTTLLGVKGRGKQKSPTKVSTTVRFDPDVLEAFRSSGRGWQGRMNQALKDWLKEHAAR